MTEQSYIDIDPIKDKLAKTEFETLYYEYTLRRIYGRDMDSDNPDMESDRESNR